MNLDIREIAILSLSLLSMLNGVALTFFGYSNYAFAKSYRLISQRTEEAGNSVAASGYATAAAQHTTSTAFCLVFGFLCFMIPFFLIIAFNT